jgi:peptidoglycan-associated lipoprotein
LSVFLPIALLLLSGCQPNKGPEPLEPTPPDMRPAEPRTATPVEPEEIEVVSEPWSSPAPAVEKLSATALENQARQFTEDEVLSDIFFPFDRSELNDEARDRLKSHARWLRDHPNFGLLIEGHCDERDTEEYNLALGDHRSHSARDFLILLGIEPHRLQSISYGEERPVDRGHSEAAWSKNRRGHFVIQVIEETTADLGG